MCGAFLSQCLGPIAANVYIASSDVYTLGQFQAWQASLDVSLNGGVIWKLLSHALSECFSILSFSQKFAIVRFQKFEIVPALLNEVHEKRTFG